MYMYIHVHGFKAHLRQIIFLWKKSGCRVMCCLIIVVVVSLYLYMYIVYMYHDVHLIK